LEDARIGNLSNEQKELMEHLKNDNQRMLKILSELLNLGQVETGKIQLNIQPASPYNMLTNSLENIASVAKEKQVFIVQQIEENLPMVNADADKVSWVLNNFLTNAIKFSPKNGNIIVSMKQTGDKICFIIQDEGPGINKEYQSRIFERYFQVPNRTDYKGSGIGLAICKELIEAMNGTIWVSSEINTGSSFGFALTANHAN
jgi:signal transduction histidine kinase